MWQGWTLVEVLHPPEGTAAAPSAIKGVDVHRRGPIHGFVALCQYWERWQSLLTSSQTLAHILPSYISQCPNKH